MTQNKNKNNIMTQDDSKILEIDPYDWKLFKIDPMTKNNKKYLKLINRGPDGSVKTSIPI